MPSRAARFRRAAAAGFARQAKFVSAELLGRPLSCPPDTSRAVVPGTLRVIVPGLPLLPPRVERVWWQVAVRAGHRVTVFCRRIFTAPSPSSRATAYRLPPAWIHVRRYRHRRRAGSCFVLVPGLEPGRPIRALAPQTSVSTIPPDEQMLGREYQVRVPPSPGSRVRSGCLAPGCL